jgi:hypothetical protein
MAHLPCCNLHPDCRMVPTVVLVHNSIGATEIFEAYQCRRMRCTRHYTAETSHFDITDQSLRARRRLNSAEPLLSASRRNPLCPVVR